MGYCYRSTQDLRRLSAEGNKEAQEWLIRRFQDENPDLSIVAGHVLIKLDATDGYIRMSVSITEGTSLENIRQSWADIAEWQRRLTEWQGRWKGRMIWSSKAALYGYLDSQSQQQSYAALANWVNRLLVNLLECDTEAQAVCMVQALQILEWLGMSNEDASQWCLAISQEIREGHEPFPPQGGPVDRDRLREQLRYWRKQA